MSKCHQRLVGRLAAIGLLALAGCGDAASTYDANVQGTVTIDGELAPGGSVTFTPQGKGPVATGVVGPDGSFVLKVGGGAAADPNRSMIPSGKYVAAVVVTGAPVANPDDEAAPPQAGPRLMADKYADKDTSGLEFEVAKGTNVFELKLEGPSANPLEDPANDADESTAAESAEAGAAQASEGEAKVEAEATSEAGAPPADGAAPANESDAPDSSGEEAKQ